MSRVVVEGPVVGETGVRREQLLVENGRVTQRGALGLEADFSFDDEHLIFPGFGDIHVHLREGEEHKEDFFTGTEAALNGGVTFCCDMPNNPVPAVDGPSFENKQRKLPQGALHIELYAALGPGTKPFGAARYKGFLAHSTGPLFFQTLDQASEVISLYRGQQITFHCECPEILKESEGELNHELSRPNRAEAEAVKRVLQWVDEFGIRANIAHLSTAEALTLVIDRHDVTFEATPHHLFFDTENRGDYPRGELLKMNPPLRSAADRAALLAAFRSGRTDFLATDHAPHTLAEKLSSQPPSGVPHLDTYGLFVGWLLVTQKVSPEILLAACCARPAEFLGLGDRGHLRPGARADMAILDLSTPHLVRAEDLATKCGWSPFEGVTFPATLAAVFSDGKRVR